MGESHPPRLPNVFIRPESEAVYSWVRSMQVAQKVVAANMLKPAPSDSRMMAAILLGALLPSHSRMPDENMPIHAPILLPCLRPSQRTAKSENHPPSGASSTTPM